MVHETHSEKKIQKHETKPLTGGSYSEVIVVTSGKGGVGKTTTTANIGAGLSWLGKKVIVIDTDLGLRNLDVVMGLENQIVYNLVDVIEGTCRLKQAAIRDRRYENLYLLPSAQTKDKSAISPEQMKKLTSELKDVVTTPEVSAIRDADRIIGLLEKNQIRNSSLIVNRIRMDMVRRGDMMSIDDVTEILSIPLIGAIPDDEQVVVATNQGEPVISLDSLAGKAYTNICKRILGLEVPFLNLSGHQGLFSKLSGVFHKK